MKRYQKWVTEHFICFLVKLMIITIIFSFLSFSLFIPLMNRYSSNFIVGQKFRLQFQFKASNEMKRIEPRAISQNRFAFVFIFLCKWENESNPFAFDPILFEFCCCRCCFYRIEVIEFDIPFSFVFCRSFSLSLVCFSIRDIAFVCCCSWLLSPHCQCATIYCLCVCVCIIVNFGIESCSLVFISFQWQIPWTNL